MTYCHKHRRHNCQTCIDELVSLGIQADKERIAALEATVASLKKDVDKWMILYKSADLRLTQALNDNQKHLSELRFSQAECDLTKHWAKNPMLISAISIPHECRIPEGMTSMYSHGWNDCRTAMIESAKQLQDEKP